MTAAALAAPHPAAVDAARTAHAAGGNALDMALAAALTLAVAYPHQCALGGDLVALVRRPDGAVRAIVSAGAAPAGVPVDDLRAAGDRMPPGGPHTVTVPGALAGWEQLAAEGATLPLAHHLERGAALAATGTPVVPGLARAISARRDAIAGDRGLRELLLPGGRPLTDRDTLVQPALAATLRTIAAEGSRALYGGAVGERLAAGLHDLGGVLTASDLAGHAADVTEPLTAGGLGATWYVAPPPSQGATLLALLRGLDRTNATSPAVTAVRAAAAARDALLGDPRRGPIDVDALVAAGDREGPPAPLRAAGDTVAVCAVDESGRAVSLLQSVYQTFGAAILEPQTGIVLHNRGSAFSLSPGHPGELAPGARPPHTLCPVILTTPATVVAAGCQGGRAQPQILAQLAAALARPGCDLQQALAAPRWVVGARDIGFQTETVLAEPGAAAPRAEALRSGVAVADAPGPTDLAGHVQVARIGTRGLDAASDPRADGRPLVA